MPPKIPGYPRTFRDPVHAPRSEAPPDDDDIRDSREITEDSLLREYHGQADKTRAAEARAVELERALTEARASANAAKSAPPRAPSVTLGDAKWWTVVLGALCMVGSCVATQAREFYHPAVTGAQLDDVRGDIHDLAAKLTKNEDAQTHAGDEDAARWRILQAFLCAQGLRARRLDCEAAASSVTFEAQPLKPHGAPQWKTQSTWPPLPDAKD